MVAGLLCLSGTAALAGGVLLAALSRRWRAALAVEGAGMAAVGAAGAAVLFGARRAGAGFGSGFAPAFGIDRLSGYFLLVLALIAVPAALYARDALRGGPHPRAIAALSGGFCLALV